MLYQLSNVGTGVIRKQILGRLYFVGEESVLAEEKTADHIALSFSRLSNRLLRGKKYT
jgi:hypothetical protein